MLHPPATYDQHEIDAGDRVGPMRHDDDAAAGAHSEDCLGESRRRGHCQITHCACTKYIPLTGRPAPANKIIGRVWRRKH